MTLERISLLRNTGQFDSVSAGAKLPLTKVSLLYAENGRGKTTIATILRSLKSGDATLIADRQRLGSAHPPHIVIAAAGTQFIFQNGTWTSTLPRIAVFDDAFVAVNVCSGIAIDTIHRQNLHELILGEQGVTLHTALQSHVARIEQHNKDLRNKGDAVSAALRGLMTVDAFCALASISDIDTKIQEAERELAAARSADAIQQRTVFAPLELPDFDIAALNTLLARSLPDLEAAAAAQVREHLRNLGKGSETWIGDGIGRIAAASQGKQYEACPFCVQDLTASPVIRHYQAYFSEGYETLKAAIVEVGSGIKSTHGGDASAAFERAMRVAVESREFWRAFTDIPPIDVDTAAIAREWVAAREAVLSVLRAKLTAPLEQMALSAETIAAIRAYEAHRIKIGELSSALNRCNSSILIIKEKTSSTSIASLSADLERLLSIQARYEPDTAAICDRYTAEIAAKAATVRLRDRARADLDKYRQTIFPSYEAAVNEYLRRFAAGFRIGSVASVNNRGGSSANYFVLINNVAVSISGVTGPSFKNTLSAGDRNTLALAFFFASLDRDTNLNQKIIVVDDPMTSLDEHRSLTTVQEIKRLYERVGQIIVLSHSKPFLCAIWDGADKVGRSAFRLARDGAGSTLTIWDVHQDCITEHDRRHKQVRDYITASDPAAERVVAAALRPILEAFVRVAYPADFHPGDLLGPFIGLCHQRLGESNELLSLADTTELRALLDYANRYHHNTNTGCETEMINDQELVYYATKTLAFARRG